VITNTSIEAHCQWGPQGKALGHGFFGTGFECCRDQAAVGVGLGFKARQAKTYLSDGLGFKVILSPQHRLDSCHQPQAEGLVSRAGTHRGLLQLGF